MRGFCASHTLRNHGLAMGSRLVSDGFGEVHDAAGQGTGI